MSDLEKRFHTSVRPKWNVDGTVLVGATHGALPDATRSYKYEKRISCEPRDLTLAKVFPSDVSILETNRPFIITDLTIQGRLLDFSEAKAADQNRT